ncbi:MAG: sigma-70 family RNA polymerase sigma factor [Clostridia bacterium]|nr:sigma-70 family RNA polymerase sigma factor [Clostridia bacterium]
MDDKKIIELYFARSEDAIAETDKKYGAYCVSIARSILSNAEDAEECVNDAYLGVWNSIPPAFPRVLSAFIGRIVRNIALNRLAMLSASKRTRTAEVVYEEAEELIPDTSGEDVSAEIALRDAINGFLASLPKRTRIVFMRRYWYFCSVSEIAEGMGMTEANVKVLLLRTRKKFKAYLEKEGITL